MSDVRPGARDKALHYSTAQHELVLGTSRGFGTYRTVKRLKRRNPEELLFYTLPYALKAEGIQPLAAWVRYFMETEP